MHPSVMDFLRKELKYSEIAGMEILEVGSQDVNGSPREIVQTLNPGKYIGVDFAAGRGVDVVLDVKDLSIKFGVETFDVVISTEMLEHAKDWREAVDQMKDMLRVGGLLVITTRSKGFPYHGYPHDYWRYSIEQFQQIFSDMKILTLESDPMHPGVFLKAVKEPMTGSVDLRRINVGTV